MILIKYSGGLSGEYEPLLPNSITNEVGRRLELETTEQERDATIRAWNRAYKR